MINLEKLSPYLAYDLMIKDVLSGNVFNLTEKFYNHTPHDFMYFGPALIHQVLNDEYLKPLMRPPSDLTRTIVVQGYNDGKEFVPWLKICDLCPFYGGEEIVEWINGDCSIGISFFEAKRIINQLQAWHFAIGIDPEDYIDINTLNQCHICGGDSKRHTPDCTSFTPGINTIQP